MWGIGIENPRDAPTSGGMANHLRGMISISNHTNNPPGSEPDGTYAVIPKWIIRSGKRLSANAIATYVTIMSYADNATKKAHPARETIAEDMGVSVPTVARAIKELKDFGALKTDPDQKKNRVGGYSSSRYTLAFYEPFEIDEKE